MTYRLCCIKIKEVVLEAAFWEQSPRMIARQLIGMCMVYGDVLATVLHARGYRRSENIQDGLYHPVLSMPPGSVYCPRRRNAVLLLLTTKDEGEFGGCVLVRTAEVEGGIFDGPGKLTQRLGITRHGMRGEVQREDEDTLILSLHEEQHRVHTQERHAFPHPIQGIGMGTLKRLMPELAKVYLRVKPQMNFRGWLDVLLCEYATEAALRKALRAELG